MILQLTHSLSSFAYFAFISSYLTLIILSEVLLLLCDCCVRFLQPFLVDVNRYNSSSGFCSALPSSVNGRQFNQEVLPDDVASVSKYSFAHTTQVLSVMLLI